MDKVHNISTDELVKLFQLMFETISSCFVFHSTDDTS